MEERDLNSSEEKSYYPIMGDFATKVTKIQRMSKKNISQKTILHKHLKQW